MSQDYQPGQKTKIFELINLLSVAHLIFFLIIYKIVNIFHLILTFKSRLIGICTAT